MENVKENIFVELRQDVSNQYYTCVETKARGASP